MRNVRDLTDQYFNRLHVLRRAGSSEAGAALWECECECGAICIKAGRDIVRGRTKSCGCLQKETAARIAKAQTGIKKKTYTRHVKWRDLFATDKQGAFHEKDK